MAGKGLSRHTQENIFHRRDYEGYKACPPATNLPIRSRRLVSGLHPVYPYVFTSDSWVSSLDLYHYSDDGHNRCSSGHWGGRLSRE
jgi:hypothetical protein